MKDVVTACHGCLVWGGHVNLSPADDILISVERPLAIDTREQMVASIMSKKLAAGSTHLLIDLPVGPTAKVTNAVEAMRLRKLFEFVGDHFGIAVEVMITDGRQPIGNGIGPVLEARDVMAVLANEPAAPRDLREKSLRLAAHLLEYDPELRGGTGYARARELLDSGAALKQMHKIIEAQGPSGCRTDLGNLTVDIRRRATAWSRRSTACGSTGWRAPPARRSTRAPASRCSRRSATASSRASRSIAFMPSTTREFDLALAGAKADTGYVDRQPAHPASASRDRAALQCLPSAADAARRLAARLGIAVHEIALHRFPDGELRVTVGPAAADHHRLSPRSISPTTSCWRCCLPAKPCGAAARSGWCWSRPISATCGRTRPFTPARRSARRSSAQLLGGKRSTASSRSTRICIAPPDIRDVFPGIEADNLSAMPAIADGAARRWHRSRHGGGRARRGIAALGRAISRVGSGSTHAVARKTPAQRPLGRDRLCRCRRCSPAGRRC